MLLSRLVAMPLRLRAIIAENGVKSPFSEYDHFYCNSKRDAAHTRLICKKTHNALAYGSRGTLGMGTFTLLWTILSH